LRATLLLLGTTVLTSLALTVNSSHGMEVQSTMFNTPGLTMKSLEGENVDFGKYRGKVLLIVNVASECGYTYQYEGLQNLHSRYSSQGLVVLGFPSNEFGKQEPGTMVQIKDFCERNYGVQFDMFAKIVVTGRKKVPLYDFLTSSSTNVESPGEIEWNFEKFLIDRNGEIHSRFRSAIEPESVEVIQAIESALDPR